MNFAKLPRSAEDSTSISSGSVTRWISPFKEGDEDAVSQLWKRYFVSLVAIARSKLGTLPSSAVDAEDIALSAFHALFRSASADRFTEMNDRDELWRSLLLITSGKVLDAKRREFCKKRGGAEKTQAPLELLDLVKSGEPDPNIAAILSEEFNTLLDCLEDKELREIAILKLDGFNNEEISARLNCSERTIKRRLAMIRRIWEEAGLAPS